MAARKKAASKGTASKGTTSKATTSKAASRKKASKKAASRSAGAQAGASRKAGARKKAPATPPPETTTPAPQRRFDHIEPRAHPDAGLTKAQVRKLYQKLLEERDGINARIRQRVGEATQDATPLAEEGDIAQRAAEQDYQLRLADKQVKLLDQVLKALQKLETGEYGLCEGSEEPIGYRRLELRPWARYSVEYKERLDRMNR